MYAVQNKLINGDTLLPNLQFILLLGYRLYLEGEKIDRKVIEDVGWSIETLSKIYRCKLEIILASVDMLCLYISW